MNVVELELKAVEDKGVWYLETRFKGKCWRDKVENADAKRPNTEAAAYAFMQEAADCIRQSVLSD